MKNLNMNDQRYLIDNAELLRTTQAELERMDADTLYDYLLDCVAVYGNDGLELNELGYRCEAICNRLSALP